MGFFWGSLIHIPKIGDGDLESSKFPSKKSPIPRWGFGIFEAEKFTKNPQNLQNPGIYIWKFSGMEIFLYPTKKQPLKLYEEFSNVILYGIDWDRISWDDLIPSHE